MPKEYADKRDFSRTPEPKPGTTQGIGPLIFVIQKHSSRRLHWDLRLELDGQLKSWAVPKEPSPDPTIKRLAVMVEDHPIEYATFEGTIPAGEYGAGTVMVWDRGTYSPYDGDRLFFEDREEAQRQLRQQLAEGKLSVFFRGDRVNGRWALVKMRGKTNDWLLIKHNDPGPRSAQKVTTAGNSAPSTTSRQASPIEVASAAGADKAPFPEWVKPMLASLTGAPFSNPEWLFEPKLDGFRTFAYVRKGEPRLLSRNAIDVTARYSCVADSLADTRHDLVLDGEVVSLDEKGRLCFPCLQQSLTPGRSDMPAYRLIYYVFDILYLDGFDIRGVPLTRRKDYLSSVVSTTDCVRLIEHFDSSGVAVYEAAVSQGLEGVMAKRKDSKYESGKRSRNWLKVKAVLSDEFVIGGYSQGRGNRSPTIGALLLGHFNSDDRLVYVGHVGSGFDEKTRSDLMSRLAPLRTEESPFTTAPPLNAPTTWTRPELVAEVKFAEWTPGGYLRQPVFLRLRDDKTAREVRRMETVPSPTTSSAVMSSSTGQASSKEAPLTELLTNPADSFYVQVEGHRIRLGNMNKVLWPGLSDRRALTKRDLIAYLAAVSGVLLPHLRNRPLTLSRYPDGIYGEHFYQKHWDGPIPAFVETVRISTEHSLKDGYLVCNNLASLIWLGQIGDMELHTWFSRISADSDQVATGEPLSKEVIDRRLDFPDYMVFDLDPYIYSGKEKPGAEPEFNPPAFEKTCQVALWLKDVLDGLSLRAFVKTSGRTGLHVHVPVLPEYDYAQIRSVAGTIARFLLEPHPKDVTTEWTVEERTGRIFIDYNQNVRGKTLACAYSPRPAPEATVSFPLNWDDLGRALPTGFNILNVPGKVAVTGDVWAGILDGRSDLKRILQRS